eukprot:209271-Rhodomonas_salina.1
MAPYQNTKPSVLRAMPSTTRQAWYYRVVLGTRPGTRHCVYLIWPSRPTPTRTIRGIGSDERCSASASTARPSQYRTWRRARIGA